MASKPCWEENVTYEYLTVLTDAKHIILNRKEITEEQAKESIQRMRMKRVGKEYTRDLPNGNTKIIRENTQTKKKTGKHKASWTHEVYTRWWMGDLE